MKNNPIEILILETDKSSAEFLSKVLKGKIPILSHHVSSAEQAIKQLKRNLSIKTFICGYGVDNHEEQQIEQRVLDFALKNRKDVKTISYPSFLRSEIMISKNKVLMIGKNELFELMNKSIDYF